MKYKIRKKAGPLLALLLCLTFVLPARASVTDKQINDAKKKQQELDQKKKDSQKQLDDLKKSKKDLEASKNKLDSDLEKLSKEVASIGNDLSKKQEEIDAAKKKLASAKRREKQQYADMKQRIKFSYEKGDADYLEFFLSSKSIGEFLNRIEYANQIVSYDRDMLKSYEKTRKLIASTEKKLNEEQKELQGLKAKAKDKQNEVSDRLNSTKSDINKRSGDISDKEDQVSDYENQLKEQEDRLDKLKQARDEELAKKIAAEKKKKEQASQSGEGNSNGGGSGSGSGGSNSGGSGSNSPGGSTKPDIQTGDLELMAAIIECEAGGESYAGMLAVGSVVMNRVRSSYFPNTISGVIYQSGQFSPVASGRLAIVLARGARDTCRQAASQSMNGPSTVGGCLFFRMARPGDKTGNGCILIGNQFFY